MLLLHQMHDGVFTAAIQVTNAPSHPGSSFYTRASIGKKVSVSIFVPLALMKLHYTLRSCSCCCSSTAITGMKAFTVALQFAAPTIRVCVHVEISRAATLVGFPPDMPGPQSLIAL